MSSVKVSVGKYQDYLITSLRDPQAAAAYLNAILAEADPEPGLFDDALEDVAMALGGAELPSQVGGDRAAIIHDLNGYLTSLGLRLVITQMPVLSAHSTH
jgi:DNA-binding phage protein